MKTITYNEQTHRLVPIEPTESMAAAGWHDAVEHEADNVDIYDIAAIYHAMLSAAPQPEPVEVDLFGAALVDTDTAEAVMFYSPDMFPDMATIKDRFELVKVYTAPPDYEAVKKQRDELAKALKWSLGNINCEPFEWTCEEDADAHRSAVESLESVKGETK